MKPRRAPGRLAAIALVGLLAACGCRERSGPTPPARPGTIRFTDITATAGVAWRHVNGASGRFYYPELLGGGGGMVDLNGDGWLDVVLVNSGALPGYVGPSGRHAVYVNNRDGTFAEVDAGLGPPAYAMGIAAGDVDGDGRTDLYLTGLDAGTLYLNVTDHGDSPRFRRDAGAANRGHWGTAASWVDVNRDGRLDLFVGNYVQWSPEKEVACRRRGLRTYCGPSGYSADTCRLYLNQGSASFKDVTQEAGLGLPAKALGVVTLDIEGDLLPDLLVASDQTPNLLFRNRGGRFQEIAVERGVALSERGLPRAGMGIDAVEEPGAKWSIWIGNFTGEGAAWFRSAGAGSFHDAAPGGLGPATADVLTFGLVAEDFDHDGRIDLALANGHVDLLAERTRPGETARQPARIMQRMPDTRFADVSGRAGEPFARKYLGRALARGDLDNDGDADLLMVENNGPAHLWRNDTQRQGTWIGFDCRTKAGGGAAAIGARVEVETERGPQVRWVRGDGSYLSAHDFRVLFGLWHSPREVTVRVRWPDGHTDTHENVPPGKYYRMSPGRPPGPLAYGS